jgi:aldehyde dehydrogenase (NAD+)
MQGANLIGGQWVETGRWNEVRNPARTDEVVGRFAMGGAVEVDAAVAAARAAFPAWRAASPEVRADLLERVGLRLAHEADRLGALLTAEEGKTLAEAKGEVLRASRIFRFFAGEALRLSGEVLPSVRAGVEVQITREPLGVIGLITPWNFPIAIPAWKSAPALAFGNTVVIKPAAATPASAWELARILTDCGAPAGVFNLVMGSGAEVGNRLVEHPDVPAISFTGSVETGRRVAVRCAERNAKVQLEMGGKNPLIVLDDADLDVAVATAVNSAFFATGQRCTASSRIIVTPGIYDAFVARMLERVRTLRVGDPTDPAIEMGPVANEGQLAGNLRYVAIAAEEGAEVVGGQRIEALPQGLYQAPALFLGASNSMRVAREEIFGPCAAVIRADDFEQALGIANDTPFGLSAGICTTSLRHAAQFRIRAQAGMVMVNLPTAGVDYHVPFGGSKASSQGSREQGRYAAEFFTRVKTSYVAA